MAIAKTGLAQVFCKIESAVLWVDHKVVYVVLVFKERK